MPTTEEAFLTKVIERVGEVELAPVRHATRTVLSMLRSYLSPQSRQLVFDELPLFPVITHDSAPDPSSADQQFLGPGMSFAQARAVLEGVYAVLGESLSSDVLTRVRREVPSRLADALTSARRNTQASSHA